MSPRSDTCKIVQSAPTDAVALARVHSTAFERPWSNEEFTNLLSAAGVCGWHVTQAPNNSLSGFVLTRRAADEAEILTLVIEPSFRRLGLARSLVQQALKDLADNAVAAVLLEVAADNHAALSLYKALGFAEVGRRKDYYGSVTGRQTDALILRCDLEAVKPV